MFEFLVHACQQVLKFKVDEPFLGLSYLQQYFPGATGLAYFNEEGLQIHLLARSEDEIPLDKNCRNYSVSYKSSKNFS